MSFSREASPPFITLRLTRDSVAMGDDMDAPHERKIDVRAYADPVELARHVCSLRYLAQVGGLGHSWSCVLNGAWIATIRGNCQRIEAKVREVGYAEQNHLDFSYTSSTR